MRHLSGRGRVADRLNCCVVVRCCNRPSSCSSVLGISKIEKPVLRETLSSQGAFESLDEPPEGAPWQLGDVIVAFGTTAGEADAGGLALADHLSHLVVHGALHLFGYDHILDEDAEEMEALETRVLAGLGVAAPYGPVGPCE